MKEVTLIDNSGIYTPWKGLTKSRIAQRADVIVSQVLEEGNVLEIAEVLSVMEEFIKAVKKDARFIDYTREELAKNAGKTTTAAGTKIEAAEVGTKYDFGNTCDKQLGRLYHQQEIINEQVKARETFLKAVPAQGMEILEEDEVIKIFPPSKSSTSSYKVTLSK